MRARNIKPGLYANELLAECSLAARLLFPGLWMMADREGRLEDRPKKIKAGVFPYDNFDTKPLLDELEYKGFIVRYEVQGGKYIEIINFLKHQKPHHNEKESEIPPRDQLATKEASTCDQGSKHLQPRSKALAPDSLIPDSLIPDSGDVDTPRKRGARCASRPTDVSETVWQDFQQLRAKKRAPLTDTALDGLKREAEKARLPLQAAIAYCCEQGWQTFNAGWHAERTREKPPPQAGGFVNKQEALEARNRAVAAEWVKEMEAKYAAG